MMFFYNRRKIVVEGSGRVCRPLVSESFSARHHQDYWANVEEFSHEPL